MSIDEKALNDGYEAAQDHMAFGIYRHAVRAYISALAAKEQPDELSGLKPCPFCGRPAQMRDAGDGDSYIGCNNGNCKVFPTTQAFSNSDGAIDAWNQRPTERESVSPPLDMGMKMADVRVGMKMKSLYGGPEITVTELTEKGFLYSHPPYHLGARIGQTTGGEHYGYNGYSHYTQINGKSK